MFNIYVTFTTSIMMDWCICDGKPELLPS